MGIPPYCTHRSIVSQIRIVPPIRKARPVITPIRTASFTRFSHAPSVMASSSFPFPRYSYSLRCRTTAGARDGSVSTDKNPGRADGISARRARRYVRQTPRVSLACTPLPVNLILPQATSSSEILYRSMPISLPFPTIATLIFNLHSKSSPRA